MACVPGRQGGLSYSAGQHATLVAPGEGEQIPDSMYAFMQVFEMKPTGLSTGQPFSDSENGAPQA